MSDQARVPQSARYQLTRQLIVRALLELNAEIPTQQPTSNVASGAGTAAAAAEVNEGPNSCNERARLDTFLAATLPRLFAAAATVSPRSISNFSSLLSSTSTHVSALSSVLSSVVSSSLPLLLPSSLSETAVSTLPVEATVVGATAAAAAPPAFDRDFYVTRVVPKLKAMIADERRLLFGDEARASGVLMPPPPTPLSHGADGGGGGGGGGAGGDKAQNNNNTANIHATTSDQQQQQLVELFEQVVALARRRQALNERVIECRKLLRDVLGHPQWALRAKLPQVEVKHAEAAVDIYRRKLGKVQQEIHDLYRWYRFDEAVDTVAKEFDTEIAALRNALSVHERRRSAYEKARAISPEIDDWLEKYQSAMNALKGLKAYRLEDE